MAWFGGERSVDEQLRGLDYALANANGKTVADLGCAEGDISYEFAYHGATSIYACDTNAKFILSACDRSRYDGVINFEVQELSELIRIERQCAMEDQRPVHQYDIVLALAILHKMHDMEGTARYLADATRELLVIRLPKTARAGVVKSKHKPGARVDLLPLMHECGLQFRFDREGPRGERVWYFERVR